MGDSYYEQAQKPSKEIKLPELDAVTYQYPGNPTVVEHTYPEFTCVCPKTGLPDFANVTIKYIPTNKIIELKSFKLYMVAFRNIGIFHEHFTNRILDDFIKVTQPLCAEIIVNVANRGGVYTTVQREYKSKDFIELGPTCQIFHQWMERRI